MSREISLSLARVWRKYMRLTRGRVPSLRALEVIAAEEDTASVKELVEALSAGMNDGLTISESAVKHGKLISPAVLELLRHAEKTGAWDEIMTEIAEGLEEGTFSVSV